MYEIRMTDSWSLEDKSLQWSERNSNLSLWCVHEFLVLVLGFAASFLPTDRVQTGVVAANECVLITVGLCLALEYCKYPSFEWRVGLLEYFKMADFIDRQSISFSTLFSPQEETKHAALFYEIRKRQDIVFAHAVSASAFLPASLEWLYVYMYLISVITLLYVLNPRQIINSTDCLFSLCFTGNVLDYGVCL